MAAITSASVDGLFKWQGDHWLELTVGGLDWRGAGSSDGFVRNKLDSVPLVPNLAQYHHLGTTQLVQDILPQRLGPQIWQSLRPGVAR